MVAWAQAKFPGGPEALSTLVTPDLGLGIVTRMMFDAREDGTLHFRPDNLCERALIERLCRHVRIKELVSECARQALEERDERFRGRPGPELLSLMMRIRSGDGPAAISTPSSKMQRLALCRIVRVIAGRFGIPTTRRHGPAGRRTACDVAAEAWPDQIKSPNAAIRIWANHKKQWWIDIVDIQVTETHVNTQLMVTCWSAPARNRLAADQMLQVTVELLKAEADYSSDLWMWGKNSEAAKDIIMRGMADLASFPRLPGQAQLAD